MDKIDVFKNSKMKIMYSSPSRIISWITIVLVIIVSFFIISISYRYNTYIEVISYVNINEKYNIRGIIEKKDMPIKKNYKLYIEGKRYEYEIVDIKEYDNYYELFIKCKVDKNLLINNNLLTLNFVKNKTTLMNEIIKKIKKGMML